MAKKFIVTNDNELRVASGIDFHKELLPKDHTTCKGGGWWAMDIENNILYLYGKSMDFGFCPKETLLEVIKECNYSPRYDGWTFMYSSELEFKKETFVELI